MRTWRVGWTMMAAAALLLPAAPAIAQDHGSGGHGGGGGGGCGDLFGDLIHIVRDDVTGQPILAKRWIEMPKEIPGYGWGYCPIPVDIDGVELGFAPLSCDVDPADEARVVEVDYFGRLSGGRVKERNIRMHFDEVIRKIRHSEVVDRNAAGRLKMGEGCDLGSDPITCSLWIELDSPVENMAVFHRLMKYGHFQTDPNEEDLWAHGDPAAGTEYHPALRANDWGKFVGELVHLVPGKVGEEAECFYSNPDSLAPPDVPFNPQCAVPHTLKKHDFNQAASLLGTAASKDGWVTDHLVQYLGRILRLTVDTTDNPSGGSLPTRKTLPALVRECQVEAGWDPDPDSEDQVEPPYVFTDCEVVEAIPAMENYELFVDLQEEFVDFGKVNFKRWQRYRDEAGIPLEVAVIEPLGWVQEPCDFDPGSEEPYCAAASWMPVQDPGVPLIEWLRSVNSGLGSGRDIDGFVKATNDAIRSVQFIHNYRIPVDLWDFDY